ncbi:MAG: HD domain-containing protein [Actinomycetia bacterium]|nr:HD domain-containing protein [Actinomycetes bacterium]MCP5034117.1 HD domain-containing protein [Actinomycetes bacterium]
MASLIATGWHLARRFIDSLWPGPPATLDETWAQSYLSDGEQTIWHRMSNPDRRHAIHVARTVVDAFGGEVDDQVVVAALLHDCGKVVSQLGTMSRVGATLLWAVIDDSRASRWLDAPSTLGRRLAQYRRHPQLGAVLLAAVDSDLLVVSWAGEHHLGPHAWTVAPEIANVLRACDVPSWGARLRGLANEVRR